MKRSARLFNQSKHAALIGLVFIAFGMAAGCWAPAANLIGGGLGAASVVAGVLCLFLVTIGILQLAESLRLRRLANVEARIEYERTIRPRL